MLGGCRVLAAAAVVARTVKLCEPSREAFENGDVHGAAASPSTLHSNVADATFDVNSNRAMVSFENSRGASVIVVSNGPETPPPSARPAVAAEGVFVRNAARSDREADEQTVRTHL